MTIKLGIINEAIVVGIFINDHRWASRSARAGAVIECRGITALCAVTRGVSDGRGHHEVGTRGRCIKADIDAVIEHRLGDGAGKEGVAVLVGDGDCVAHHSARA